MYITFLSDMDVNLLMRALFLKLKAFMFYSFFFNELYIMILSEL
jgi:hypothetical protein